MRSLLDRFRQGLARTRQSFAQGLRGALGRGRVDEELSLGDFVLSGGEIAALAVVDAVVRLLPGVLGDFDSAQGDSYHDDWLLGPPSYTRPAEYEGMKVPQVLLSGDHAAVARWRAQAAERLTRERRPDLWEAYQNRKKP